MSSPASWWCASTCRTRRRQVGMQLQTALGFHRDSIPALSLTCHHLGVRSLPPTLQSFIQSRGRARMANSNLVMMVQEDLEEEAQVLQRAPPGAQFRLHLILRGLCALNARLGLSGERGTCTPESAARPCTLYINPLCIPACLPKQMVAHMVEYEQQLRQVGRRRGTCCSQSLKCT